MGGQQTPLFSFGDNRMNRVDTVEYDNVKIVFNHGDYTATVVHGMGAIRVTTVYPMNWVADGSNVLDFMSKIRMFDLQARQLQSKLGLPV